MPTTVIHIRDAPAGWRENPEYVYIGRGSRWGNPYTVATHGRQRCIILFAQAFNRETGVLHYLQGRLDLLKDKILVCYCMPEACHGEILAQAADRE